MEKFLCFNSDIFFNTWYETEQRRLFVYLFCNIITQGGSTVSTQYIVFSIVLLYTHFWPTLYITTLLITGSLPLKDFFFVLLLEIFNPCLGVNVSILCTKICTGSSESVTITWSSRNKNILTSIILEILIRFTASSFHSVIIYYYYYY